MSNMMSATLTAVPPPPPQSTASSLDCLDFYKLARTVAGGLPTSPDKLQPLQGRGVFDFSMFEGHTAGSTAPKLSNQGTPFAREVSASDSSASEPSHEEGSSSPRPDPTLWRPLALPSQRLRLNKFVRRLHDMLVEERDGGIVEWRRGLLVLHSTDAFTKSILPKHFNTRNFKTFRRQLNYYGFIHVRSFSTTGSTTTALWVNRELADAGSEDVESVLLLKRVEPCESAKTAEGRRVRKERAIHTVEEDLGVSARSLQMDQIRAMAVVRRNGDDDELLGGGASSPQNHLEPLARWALAAPPPLVFLPAPVVPIAKDDDKASAANLLLLLSKSG